VLSAVRHVVELNVLACIFPCSHPCTTCSASFSFTFISPLRTRAGHCTAAPSLLRLSYFTQFLERSKKLRLIYFCRVVILVIVMLIVVPLLNISEIDNTQLIAVELLQQMAVYNANSTSSYGVRRLLLFMSGYHMIHVM
jgi:hypothetical protein